MTGRADERVDVAVIGGGPAGLGVATALGERRVGRILLIERGAELGGIPAKYPAKPGGVPTFVAYARGRVVFGSDYVRPLVERVAGLDVRIWLESQVTEVNARASTLTVVSPDRGRVEVEARAIVFATGAREQTLAERGWLDGDRPARVLFTTHLLELLDGHGRLPARRPVIVGSDLIACAAAAKLAAAGAEDVAMIDGPKRPRASLAARLYFRRWGAPEYVGGSGRITVRGDQVVRSLLLDDRLSLPADAVLLCGLLVPNSELVVEAGLATRRPHGSPVADRRGVLSEPSCYAAGNVLGGFHGAEWCHRSGRRVGRAVARFLALGGL